MEFLEGLPLSRLIEGGPLPLSQALRIAADASGALAAAHAHAIVHHDIAPANIFVTGEGQVKILDFGLAEIARQQAASDGLSVRGPAAVVAGDTPADPAAAEGSSDYMSPEKIRGEAVDAHTDVYSLGVVLYEMLCGRRPFRADSARPVLTAILEDQPAPPRTLRRGIPHRVERLLLRCLEKKPEDRYSSAAELHRELDTCLASVESGAWRRPAAVAAVAAAVLLLGAVGFIGVRAAVQASRSRWVEREALPAVARLIQEERPLAALELVRKAERLAPPPAQLIRFKDRLPALQVSIRTAPPGAAIYALDYRDKEDRDASRWVQLGRSPLDTNRLPAGDYRVRAVRDGFETVERLFAITADGERSIDLQLHARASVPPEMVWVPDTGPEGLGKTMFPAVPDEVPGFWFDRHEVTNREFKRFVDADGYQRREYWKQPFIRAWRELTWDEAMLEFRDPSGKAGPATWELGSYADGRAEYPVSGVSWYEAAAYAEFVGKSLPTVHQWLRAAGVGMGTFFQVIESSNFARKGPAPAESYRGLGPFGTYDMAGNVREWCWNPALGRRFSLGGGSSDPPYQLIFASAFDPFFRGATNGFRCARNASSLPVALTGEVTFVLRDRRRDKPAGDESYRIYRDLHSYDKTDLKAAVESSDDTAPYWRRERITFQAAYGSERMIAYLYLPRNAAPPYQVVAFFPGSTALVAPTADAPGVFQVPAEHVVRSGRALILPVYKGMMDRGPGTYYHWVGQPNLWRDLNLQWSKDLGRSIDYLETRSDIESGKLAYLGLSLGAAMGPRLIAVEPRFKAGILLLGGSFEQVSPEVDAWNFAPHVKIPVLTVNGSDDFFFPVEASQLPLFRLLGTPEKDKKRVLYDGAHNVYARLDVAKDMLDWLDRYLGRVDLRR